MEMPCFILCGMNVAAGIVFDRSQEQLKRWASPLTIGATLAFFASLLLPKSINHYQVNGLLAPLFVLFLWGFGASPNTMLARTLRSPPLVFLGEASYGLYILQLPVRFMYPPFVERFSLSANAFFWLYYLVLLMAAVVCLGWIDAPMRKAIKRGYARFLRPLSAAAMRGPAQGHVDTAEG